MNGAERLCLALDVPTAASAESWVRRTQGAFSVYKIGLQLFLAEGPTVVERVIAAGAANVFLDLKLHDIPRTVARAVTSLSSLGVRYLTLHTAGGREMLSAAAEAAGPAGIQLLGVTVLTSLDDTALNETGVSESSQACVLRRGRLALDSGVDGLVCSALEVGDLRRTLGSKCTLVTPGIRLSGGAVGDQKRVATPAAAVAAGASLLVIGRAVTAAVDADAAVRAIQADLRDG